MNIDETEICYICGIQCECTTGFEESALCGEWVCNDCREAGKVQEILDNEETK